MKMTIDAMDLLYRGRVDGFGIMSSDSDFMPLAMRIRQDGLPVYGFGNGNTPESFREACTRFIDMKARAEAERGGSLAVDDDVINLLIDAYQASKRDENGWAKLSTVGQRAGNRSSFDVRSYGFKRLSELVEAVGNFGTEKRADGLYVKRLR